VSTAASALQAVLFDLDGLLVDSEPLWFEAEEAVAARLGGGPWTGGDQQALLGGTLERTVRYLLDRGSVDADPAEVARWLVDGMADLIRDRGLALRPGAGHLHAELASARIPVALVSSSRPEVVTAALHATGLRFDLVVTGADVRNGKPHPEPYLHAAAALGAEPSRCVALEDSPTGAASARAAGCAVVYVPGPGQARQPAGGRQLVLSSLTEVDLSVLRSLIVRPHASQRSRY
jgi:HAD superfamily hydrolase (TIGR01509 family)